ncbi:hypothetical protein SPHV1_100045 [Novosphingobium sp. KN65.2]|nr:hypothetical protein SPHV1_100045 [Novosphingobium sp. KN65.2]
MRSPSKHTIDFVLIDAAFSRLAPGPLHQAVPEAPESELQVFGPALTLRETEEAVIGPAHRGMGRDVATPMIGAEPLIIGEPALGISGTLAALDRAGVSVPVFAAAIITTDEALPHADATQLAEGNITATGADRSLDHNAAFELSLKLLRCCRDLYIQESLDRVA